MHNQTFKKETIIGSFRHTGLVPFNPAIVIDKVKEIQQARAARPRTPPQPVVPNLVKTPRTTKDVVDHGEILQLTISQAGMNPVYLAYIERFLKGAIATAHSAALSEAELLKAKSAAIAKAARKRLAGTVALKGGVITATGLRHMAQKRVEDEELKARAVIQRVEDKRAREAAKIANRAAIDARKAERLAKKAEKDLIKAQKLVRLGTLIDL